MRTAIAAALLSFSTAALCAEGAPQANPFPPGEGRDIVATACTQCHGPNVFTQLRMGPEGWRRQVYDMVLRGAQVQPSEADAAVKYLTANFGPGNNVPPPMVKLALPEGDGKALVEARCGVLCHGLDRAASAKRTPAEWNAVLSRMVFLGAPVSGDEFKTISTYLNQRVGQK